MIRKPKNVRTHAGNAAATLIILLWCLNNCGNVCAASAMSYQILGESHRQLVVGGQDAIQGRFPYFVSMNYNNGVVLNGALIASVSLERD